MRLKSPALFILGIYFTLVIFWLCSSLFITGNSHISFSTILNGFKNSTHYGYIFAFTYSFIPFFGSLIGFNIAKKWGFFNNNVGKAVFFFSASLLSWALGEFIWSFYNFFLNANVPYPSWADAGFVLNYPLWGIGMIYFGKASGASIGLHKRGRKLLLVLVPVIVSLVSWYVMVIVARGGSITSGGGPLKVFFDIAYPAGDVILLTMGSLIFGLSFRNWNAQLKWPIIVIFFGILAEYISDFWFSYSTTLNTFYNGCLGDLSFATALMILSIGVTLLDKGEEPLTNYSSVIPATQPIQSVYSATNASPTASAPIPGIIPPVTQSVPNNPITPDNQDSTR